MGRCCSKPFKRTLFAHADAIADRSLEASRAKYAEKYVNKRRKMGMDPEDPRLPSVYECELVATLERERGLAHGKAREYWLRRGPRLLLLTVAAIAANLGMSEGLKPRPENDRAYLLANGLVLLTVSCYMLYQRLPDAIESAAMRVGHDYYVSWKVGNNW